MNERREGWMARLAVKFAIDPLLRSHVGRNRLRASANKGSSWVRMILRHVIDPTILPPPSYTRARADEVYGQALRRSIEYVVRNRMEGDILEFGTLLGYTARWWAALLREHHSPCELWLYDSFEGLPKITASADQEAYEVADKVWFEGAMKVDAEIHERIRQAISAILGPERVHVVKGYFEETLPARIPERPAALVHLDCDLYGSARTVLDTLLEKGRFQDGTLLVVDDFNCNRANLAMGVRRAMTEAFACQERFACSPWFSYGWHGQTFFVHDRSVGV